MPLSALINDKCMALSCHCVRLLRQVLYDLSVVCDTANFAASSDLMLLPVQPCREFVDALLQTGQRL